MNPFPGRRRTILAERSLVNGKQDGVTEDTPAVQVAVVEAEKTKEVMSFKGLSKCPKCGKEIKRGLPMHYKHCKA